MKSRRSIFRRRLSPSWSRDPIGIYEDSYAISRGRNRGGNVVRTTRRQQGDKSNRTLKAELLALFSFITYILKTGDKPARKKSAPVRRLG